MTVQTPSAAWRETSDCEFTGGLPLVTAKAELDDGVTLPTSSELVLLEVGSRRLDGPAISGVDVD